MRLQKKDVKLRLRVDVESATCSDLTRMIRSKKKENQFVDMATLRNARRGGQKLALLPSFSVLLSLTDKKRPSGRQQNKNSSKFHLDFCFQATPI